jgi:hypothetical protein
MLLVLGLLTLLALEISLYPNSRSSSPLPNQSYGAPSYGFGGYELIRPTTEVGAQWRVPKIAAQSGDGNASTWIAAQSESQQFIQLGTTENKVDAVSQYEIFWSDVAVSFHPQQLLEVNPGDLIKFTMNQTSGGWRLHYYDVTQKVPETVTIPYARGSSFNSAQWYQEDPTVGGLTVHLTYPSVSLTTFRHMSVDGAKPQLSADDRSVLSTADGVYLIPSGVTQDHFTYANATGPARQYLSDVFAYNAALYPFQVDMFYKRSPTSTVMSHLRSALATLGTKLKTQHWPPSLTSAVKGDQKLIAAYAKLFQTFPTAPKPLSESALARLSIVTRDNYLYSDVLREQLGLPPTH